MIEEVIQTGYIIINFLIVSVFILILLYIWLKFMNKCLQEMLENHGKLHLIINKIFGK